MGFPVRTPACLLFALLGLCAVRGEQPSQPKRSDSGPKNGSRNLQSWSGPRLGSRPGPYAALIATGPQRGQSYCYVCETEDRPAVVVFARTPSEPLARLVRRIDQAVAEQQKANLRAWVTFLCAEQPVLDPQLVRWARDHGIRSVPLGIFEDPGGPPSYHLAPDAEVTVVLFVKRRVTNTFAFRAGELSETHIEEIARAMGPLAAVNR